MTDAARQAYEEFMLQGKRGGKPRSSPTVPGRKPSHRGDVSDSGRKRGKNELAVFRGFQGRLREWKDLDEQMDAVVGSVANLRDRIWWESKQVEERCHKLSRPWLDSGFRSSSRFVSALLPDDVQLALTHDLLQHEKMLALSRTLVASMAQAQDAMGRRLDEWMMMQLEEPLTEQGQELLDQGQTVFVFLAADLYRKQELVRMVLESCHSGLVDEEATNEEGIPRSIARQCSAEWRSQDLAMIKVTKQLLER